MSSDRWVSVPSASGDDSESDSDGEISSDDLRSEPESGDEDYPMQEAAQKKTVGEGKRLALNGESIKQMAHVRKIKARGGVSLQKSDGTDTSRDQDWPLDTSTFAIWTDRYVLFTTLLWMIPKILVFAIPVLAANAPPILMARVCVVTFPPGTERVRRTCCFYFMFALWFIAYIPGFLLVSIGLMLDYGVYYIFSIPFCVLTCRWSSACAGLRKVEVYSHGPSIIWYLPDLFVAQMGQCARQTMGEPLWMTSVMWLIMPWLKYYINCNPYIYDIDHRLCQQISTEMQDLGTPPQVANEARKIISRTRQRKAMRKFIDLWSFVPHYPYPPSWRRWALGLQAGGSSYPGKFTLIVHTTHAISGAGGSHEQFVLSNSCAEPIYRVMLWYNNPFHFLTGWVEASVSTGLPSQPNKKHGGEHPMWLVTARTPLVAGRDSFTGSGMIDAFFDYWLPVFVYGMRKFSYMRKFSSDADYGAARATAIADAKYTEVHSADGISKPQSRVGRHMYDGKDALSDFEHSGETMVYRHQERANVLMDDVYDTMLAKKFYRGAQTGLELGGGFC
eukprot:TRINITY_DN12918_c0_g1_i1.p1 TRINITY_DN12918_c0_g1~~TRINITY_DN12918_c0_g1_i1.p1  ORF type:complete len:560 (+),score=84.02 TRINITY_DN12918_c0_g1_i1:95-1774(+)